MSTRGIYRFSDSEVTVAVYKHYDNYPDGAAEHLLNTLFKAWPLPRFEADEFAASFVAANKKAPGDLRLLTDSHPDMWQEYEYEIFPAKNGQIILKAFETGEDAPFYYGRLKDFVKSQMNERHHGTINNLFKGDIEEAVDLEAENHNNDEILEVKNALAMLTEKVDILLKKSA